TGVVRRVGPARRALVPRAQHVRTRAAYATYAYVEKSHGKRGGTACALRVERRSRLSTDRIIAGSLLALVIATALPVRAQDGASSTPPGGDEDARLHFELGRRAFARAEYEAAATEFETSWRLSQRPELHYNLFLVYHELDRDDEAIRELR